MPMQRERYPANWKDISKRIRFERAGGKCERCGVSHDVWIVRSALDKARYIWLDEAEGIYKYPDGACIHLSEIPDEYDINKYTRVVLTTHHIGIDYPDGRQGDCHDKMDCRDENLIALCQRCHFIADLHTHIIHARESRLRHKQERIIAEGQLELFQGVEEF